MSRVRLMVGYFHPWPNDAGYYVASAEGWYREYGLDVEIVAPDPLRGDALAHLSRQEVDVAVFPTNRLLVRRENGEPLVGIASVNHVQMETIMTVGSTGIERPADLAGRRLAFNPTPRGRAMVRHLVALDGGDPDAVIEVDAGVRELNADDLAAGAADATFGNYWAWDTLFGNLPADERRVWPVGAIGAPEYHSYLLGVHESLTERNPRLVEAFLAATERGFRAAAEDPERTLAVLDRTMGYFPQPILRRSLELVAPTWTHDGRWGEQRPELMNGYAQWLADVDVLQSVDVARNATTDLFLPA